MYHEQQQEKKEEIWLSLMTKAPISAENIQNQRDNAKTTPKTSITQRLRTYLGRSDGVTTATALMWLNQVYGRPTFPQTTTAVLSKGHTFNKRFN